jgi:aminoacylase
MSFKSNPTRAHAEVTLFKELLRLKTMHPNPDLASCVAWLRQQANELGMEFNTVTYKEGIII